jgi:cellobiose phosphorylase
MAAAVSLFWTLPRDNRISRMRYNCLPWDRPGRYILVKDTETGDYWSLSWAPTIDRKYDLYEARVGQGYTPPSLPSIKVISGNPYLFRSTRQQL